MMTLHEADCYGQRRLRMFVRTLPSRIAWLCLMAGGLWFNPGCRAQSADATVRLEASVVDDATGEPLAARVAITDSQGKFIDVEGRHEHVLYLGKRWCYVEGSFALAVPKGGASIEIRRGFETRPLSATVEGGASDKTIRRTFRLHRWIDMRSKGYANGDIHAHLPIPKAAHSQMLAEDLNALTLLHMADKEYSLPTNKHFTGKLDMHSTPGCEIYVGQEVREWQMGHLTLMGIKTLVPGYPDQGGTLEHWKSFPHWDLMRALRATREQNGTVFWSHVCSLPGAELPIGVALGLVDGIELVTWNDPTQFPNHWGPWEDSGFSQAEFPVMRTMDLWYQFLNAGFRLPIAAGTDKFDEEIPLGSNRVYARTDGPPTYDSWLAAVKAGRGFVTNTPILEFEVDGRQAGDVVEFTGTKKVNARATARSILPINTLDIVLNGRKVGHKTVPLIRSDPPKDGVYSLEVEATVELAQSCWLAARVIDHPDLRNRILPRDLSVFAHTDPVYFLRDGRKVPEKPSIDYLRKYVEGTLHWLGTNPRFHLDQDAVAAREAAQEALEALRNM
ncbi:MAG TPA: CehA/McbA family metallohydrolase [Sedimentisphaerales bacterium]|nr:CehA/McbA family metallohydrolase [Sedimentisphaerales bacterium]HNU31187.1 CehA/McbA family metallohydrolase [Sedimentisphaerales bacterium]